VQADNAALSNETMRAAKVRFERIRNRAMGYAYYLRSAYLRNAVIHNPDRRRERARTREAIYSAALYLERALDFAPRSTFLWWEFAAINNGLGRVNKEIKAYERLTALDPAPELHAKLGVLYELRNEPDRAVEQYQRALAMQPDDAVLRERIADVYIDAGFKSIDRYDEELAREQFRKAMDELHILQDQSGKARHFVKEGLLYETLGNTLAALKAYEQAIDVDPDDTDSYIKASHMHFYLGKEAERSGDMTRATRHYSDAATVATPVIRKSRNKPNILNFTAYVMALGSTNLHLAEKLVTEALSLDESNGAYVDTLGWIYFKQGKVEQALKKVLRARELEGDDPVIMQHLGDIYHKLGQPAKAREMWTQSLQLDADNKSIRNKLEMLP
jgi:tetratricopeptide (TPR) repeat protein